MCGAPFPGLAYSTSYVLVLHINWEPPSPPPYGGSSALYHFVLPRSISLSSWPLPREFAAPLIFLSSESLWRPFEKSVLHGPNGVPCRKQVRSSCSIGSSPSRFYIVDAFGNEETLIPSSIALNIVVT